MEVPTSSNVPRTRPTPQDHLKRRLAPIAEAADYIGANPRTIRRYIAAGRLTGYRVGPRLIRVDLVELEAMLRPIPTASDVA
jgi:excisionase family DNA binding protein